MAEEFCVTEWLEGVPLEVGVSPSEKYVLVKPASRYVTLKSIVLFPNKSLPSSSLQIIKMRLSLKTYGIYTDIFYISPTNRKYVYNLYLHQRSVCGYDEIWL